MTRSNLAPTPTRAWAEPETKPEGGPLGRRQPASTGAQRVLAGAIAAAILLSGLNALVQVGKVALEYLSRG